MNAFASPHHHKLRLPYLTQNCRPDPDYAPLPLNYAEMLRQAFKTDTDALQMKCIASLSKTYPATKPGKASRPGDAKLGYDHVR